MNSSRPICCGLLEPWKPIVHFFTTVDFAVCRTVNNKQKVKDEVETKEQEKREHARETAKRIAHGEGYSKRKGNKK